MPVCVPRFTKSTAPTERPYTRPGQILSKTQLSPALVRHSSWPQIETAPMKNWQVELAEQHRHRMLNKSHITTSHDCTDCAQANHRIRTLSSGQWSQDGEADEEMLSDDGSYIEVYQGNSQSQWSASSSPLTDAEMEAGEWHGSDTGCPDQYLYERGAFTPVFEEDSPVLIRDHDAFSSPVGPVTPFGDFVDRAVAVSDCCDKYDGNRAGVKEPDNARNYVESPLELSPSPEVFREASPPCASAEYKKMAAPMSDFMAQYIWNVCTTGMSLPAIYGRNFSAEFEQQASKPPSYLAPAIYSMLLSTLLQPSAIALAIWYIVRLPICFEGTALGPEYTKEHNFREELLGDGNATIQVTAPFRLVILGCMLSNKWLDDHTFSNRTWQTISNLPIQSLNILESMALDIFSYDLSTPSDPWSQWLNHLLTYHQSSMAPGRIQPISRPSNNPQAIVRNTLEEVWSATCQVPADRPEAVFIGYEQRKLENIKAQQRRDKRELARQAIDLDEDGPIREEYLPRRRSSGHVSRDTVDTAALQFPTLAPVPRGKAHLPPPAKWSPAADEPIHRRSSGSYLAVQPPLCTPIETGVPKWYHDFVTHGTYFAPGKNARSAYPYDGWVHPQPYNMYAPPSTQIGMHNRSQSLARTYDVCLATAHNRSYSQAYRCSNLRMTSNENVNINADHGAWVPQQYIGHQRLPFGAAPQVNYQSSWLKA